MSTFQVAETILKQLGGRKFLAMTGAKHLLAGDNMLRMQVSGRNRAGKRFNIVSISLTPMDTYTVKTMLYSKRNLEVTDVEQRSDVYCENLQAVFTDLTGLDTHL